MGGKRVLWVIAGAFCGWTGLDLSGVVGLKAWFDALSCCLSGMRLGIIDVLLGLTAQPSPPRQATQRCRVGQSRRQQGGAVPRGWHAAGFLARVNLPQSIALRNPTHPDDDADYCPCFEARRHTARYLR